MQDVRDTSIHTQLSWGKTTDRSLEKLILSECDYEDELLHNEIVTSNLEMVKHTCDLLFTTIFDGNQKHDTFTKVHDLNGDMLILYHRHGNVYVPACQPIKTIYVLKNVTKCFASVPVLITSTTTAYLTRNKFLRLTEAEVPCENSNLEFNIDDQILIRKIVVKLILTGSTRQMCTRFSPTDWIWLIMTLIMMNNCSLMRISKLAMNNRRQVQFLNRS